MESRGLHLSIDYVGSSGIVLNPEQKASLQSSLCILQNNNKFSKVHFWGKIIGVKEDYFIAQGFGKDEMTERKTLYSRDCVNWNLLIDATPAVRKKAKLAKGRFTGDPSYEYEHVVVKKTPEGETEEEETIMIKEEERLASVIQDIDEEARIVPRGAYVKTPTGVVTENRSFEGFSLAPSFEMEDYVVKFFGRFRLAVAEAAKFGSYMHFREPQKLQEKTLLHLASLEKSIDFLDPVEEDVPKGSWSLQFERGSGLVTMRSLLWLGYVFYHVPETRQYGSIYVGNGERNIDLPFML